jgi:hypothetical protein
MSPLVVVCPDSFRSAPPDNPGMHSGGDLLARQPLAGNAFGGFLDRRDQGGTGRGAASPAILLTTSQHVPPEGRHGLPGRQRGGLFRKWPAGQDCGYLASKSAGASSPTTTLCAAAVRLLANWPICHPLRYVRLSGPTHDVRVCDRFGRFPEPAGLSECRSISRHRLHLHSVECH